MKGLRWVRNSSWRKKYFKSRKDIRPCCILRCFFLYHDFDPFPVPGIVRNPGLLHSTTATCLVLLPLSAATLPSPCCHRLLPRGLPCCHRLLKHFQVTAAMLFASSCASSPIPRYFLLHDTDPVSMEKMNENSFLLPSLRHTSATLMPHPCHSCATLLPHSSASLLPNFCHTFALLFATSFHNLFACCVPLSPTSYVPQPN